MNNKTLTFTGQVGDFRLFLMAQRKLLIYLKVQKMLNYLGRRIVYARSKHSGNGSGSI